MTVPAIIAGDRRCLLKRGPAALKDPSQWTQRDSDVLAHYLNVDGQIRRSRWYAADKSFTTQGGKTLEVSMPEFEEFVYAAVYFRQLFMKSKDFLFQDTVDRYCGHVDCAARAAWFKYEANAFNDLLDSPTFPFPIKTYTLRQIFNAFIYGAGMMHKVPDGDSTHKRFLDMYDNFPRSRVLYALNTPLMILMNHVGNVASVLHQDYAHWQHTYSLPLPEIRWHDRIFDAKSET